MTPEYLKQEYCPECELIGIQNELIFIPSSRKKYCDSCDTEFEMDGITKVKK